MDQKIKPNPKYENSSVFVCGTSPEIEILNKPILINRLEEKFYILCINTSYVYFNKISGLFLSGRFRSFTYKDFINKKIDEIYIGGRQAFFKDIKTTFYLNSVDLRNFNPKVETDLNKTLPHGPTTLLDIVFPFCAFNKVKNIYILGAEYQLDPNLYKRHSEDSKILNRKNTSMDRETELLWAHQSLNLWNDYFKNNNINCFALSEKSETPFEKINLQDLL